MKTTKKESNDTKEVSHSVGQSEVSVEKKSTSPVEEIIQFTNIRKGEIRLPNKNQMSKYSVPETELQIFENKIIINIQLSGLVASDINLSLIAESLIVVGKNKSSAYCTEIKLPKQIIPQSATAKFFNGNLIFEILIQSDAEPWQGLYEIMKTQNELLEAKTKLKNLQEQIHSIQLDYQNLLVKSKKDVENNIDTYRVSVIEKLLRSMDHFQLAINSTNKVKNKDSDIDQILIGLNMIMKELSAIIEEESVTEIPTKGLLLDPTLHEVFECIETDKHQENTILEELQKGYKYKDRVIRPSKVKVAIPKKVEEKKPGRSKSKVK